MIRPIKESDREFYIRSALDFYHSPVVLAPIPQSHIEKTFDLLLQGSPFALGYIFERDGKPCGYALLARTWSQEAGGEVIWIEEIYVLPEYRGGGHGKEFFAFLEKTFSGKAKRFRLEVEKENEGAVRLYESLGFEFFEYDQMKKEF
jgi:ribosomal protein S18 acetylase RimI-like enzyme